MRLEGDRCPKKRLEMSSHSRKKLWLLEGRHMTGHLHPAMLEISRENLGLVENMCRLCSRLLLRVVDRLLLGGYNN